MNCLATSMDFMELGEAVCVGFSTTESQTDQKIAIFQRELDPAQLFESFRVEKHFSPRAGTKLSSNY